MKFWKKERFWRLADVSSKGQPKTFLSEISFWYDMETPRPKVCKMSFSILSSFHFANLAVSYH